MSQRFYLLAASRTICRKQRVFTLKWNPLPVWAVLGEFIPAADYTSWLRWPRNHASTLDSRSRNWSYQRVLHDTLALCCAWISPKLTKLTVHGAGRSHDGLASRHKPQFCFYPFAMRLGTLIFFVFEHFRTYFLHTHSYPLPHRAGEDSGGLKTMKSEGPGRRNTSCETTIRHLFWRWVGSLSVGK